MDTYPLRVIAFVKAQQIFEGWYTPGQIVDGIEYPKGSITFQNNNPAAIRFSGWQTSAIPDGLGCLGLGVGGNYGKYATVQDGMNAGCQFLMDVIKNELIPYRNQAKLWKLPDSGSLSIAQYFQIYAPGNVDKNHPVNYAKFVADKVGVPVETPLRNLLC